MKKCGVIPFLLLFLLHVSILSVSAATNSPGSEVYGFTLGAPFPEKLRSVLRAGEDGFLRYQTECPEADVPFGLINVRVSPERHVVVDISAVGIFHVESKGQAALWGLKDRLEARYGKAKKKKQAEGDRFEIRRGRLRIVFYLRSATFEGHSVLYVNFMDIEAYKKYGKEARAALEKKVEGL